MKVDPHIGLLLISEQGLERMQGSKAGLLMKEPLVRGVLQLGNPWHGSKSFTRSPTTAKTVRPNSEAVRRFLCAFLV